MSCRVRKCCPPSKVEPKNGIKTDNIGVYSAFAAPKAPRNFFDTLTTRYNEIFFGPRGGRVARFRPEGGGGGGELQGFRRKVV